MSRPVKCQTALDDTAGYTPVRKISETLGRDHSLVLKNIRKLKIQVFSGVIPGSRGQSVAMIRDADVPAVTRKIEGTGAIQSASVNGSGFVYVIQMVPELDPLRIKIGYATNVNDRLSQYKTITPTACVLATWPSRRVWEPAAIAAISCGMKALSEEVFVVESTEEVQSRGDAFFSMLPAP